MGWTHALHWCQLVHTDILEREIPDINVLHDDSPCPDLHVAACLVYVDNGVFLGTGRATINSLCDRARSAVRAVGSETHEDDNDVIGGDLLGLQISGEGRICVKFDRRKRLYGALAHMIRLGK